MKIKLKEDSFFELKVFNLSLSFAIFVIVFSEFELLCSIFNETVSLIVFNKFLFYSLMFTGIILIVFYFLFSIKQFLNFLKMVSNYDVERFLEFKNNSILINSADERNLLEYNLSNISKIKLKLLKFSNSKGTRLKFFIIKDKRSLFDKLFDNYYETVVLDVKYGELENLMNELQKTSIDVYI